MSQFIIGLTGGIGSGKTAASDHFESLGVSVVDADVVAREVVEPGQPALQDIAKHFGKTVLTQDGELDRRQLREIIFSHPEEKDWLEALLHPLIREEIKRQLQAAASDYSILVSPLLFETDQHKLAHRTLLIDVPESLQIERATSRDNTDPEQIKKIIAAQMSRACKIEKADDIICNDEDLTYLQEQVSMLHNDYIKRAKDAADNA